MTDPLVVIVAALLVIAASSVLGPRLGIASPLVLVSVGVGASFLGVFASVEIDPEWILAGVLPPLLYSSAVSMPAMNFRREFQAISGLSVTLVVVTSLVLGLFFMLVLPDLGFAWGVALGAIISPTDAVATSIVKQVNVSKRVVAILDGESLLNDATALVLLRTAIVATAATFSFWGTLGTFAYSVVVAVVVGGVAGRLNLLVRSRVGVPAVNTVVSFAAPFIASLPAEALGGSGLVAAVVAGLVTGIRAPRDLSPMHRLSDSQNWRTVELLLEGAVFLTMGLQVRSIVSDVETDHAGAGPALLVAVGALLVTILVRSLYVAPLLRALRRKSRRSARLQPRLRDLDEKMSTSDGKIEALDTFNARGRRRISERDLDRFASRVTRGLADVGYLLREPLGWRDGAVVVWAGMRGAVTVAAAQTLPADTPQRSVLVLVAYAVAAMSLLMQGGTIGPLLRRLAPQTDQSVTDQQDDAERARLAELLQASAAAITKPDLADDASRQERFAAARQYSLAVIRAQRTALLDARDHGTFDADILTHELASLDASQIAIELRG